MELKEYFQQLWRGRVTAHETVLFFIPAWFWFVCVVFIELRDSKENVLLVTFFPVFLISVIPFFLRRVGLLRWLLFTAVIPATATAVVIQLFRSFLI